MKTPEEIKKLLAEHKNYTFSAETLFIDALAYIQQLEKKVQLLESRNDTLAAKAALFDEAMAAGEKMERERDAALDKLSVLHAELEAAQTRWISVEERLPEAKKDVLACGDVIKTAYTRGVGEGWFTYDGNKQMHNVTHWMPLPKPPEEDI